jgi:lysophospholipase L1-like esterase
LTAHKQTSNHSRVASWIQLAIAAVVVVAPARINAADLPPRALIVGDSIYNTPTRTAAALLKGRVEVVWNKFSSADSATVLENVDELLGDKKWDLIHFNFGFNDLMYKDPSTKSIRAMSKEVGGVRVTTPQQYEKNLRELLKRFKATGAKLIWATTTPIVSSKYDGILDPGSEIEYNQIAAKVMREHQVAINDMHSYVTSNIKNKRDSSPFSFDRYPMYPPIVRGILTELNLVKPVRGPVKVFLMVGGPAHTGAGMVLDANKPRAGKSGTLDDLVLNPKTAASYSHLVDKDGAWATRSDVWTQFDRRGQKSGAHGILFGGDRKRCIGPEFAFGHVVGNHFDKQVLIFKTDLGNPSLAKDLRPPSSGATGPSYTLLLSQIANALAKMENSFPDYRTSTGYEIAGVVLNLGEADTDAKTYADYLPKLIADLRKDLKEPKLPFVIVATGQGGRQETSFPGIIKAQQSVAALPQFQGNVIYTETRDFWPIKDASPEIYAEKWYGNAQSFYKMGHAIGEDLLKLLKD